jgi:DNA-binding winged helix-turn-helix (wHTH) protein
VTIEKLQFPPFLLDAAHATLWRGQQVIPLPPKAFDALQYLATHPERLVPPEELLGALWPDVKVNPGVLKVRIRQIRQALGDDAESPRFIETVPRRGYRFIGKVVSEQLSVVSPPPTAPAHAQLATDDWQLATLIVGRETELAQLHRWREKALHGERQIVFVTGEPGIGKTTLVEAFLMGIGGQGLGVSSFLPQHPTPNPQPPTPNLWIGRGQCIEHYGSGEAYLPILEALGRLGRGAEGEHLIEVLRKHAPMWLVQLPALLTATEFEALQRKTAGMTKERMLREMAEALEALTTERPLVLVLEDLHWSDPSTLWLSRRKTRPSSWKRTLGWGRSCTVRGRWSQRAPTLSKPVLFTILGNITLRSLATDGISVLLVSSLFWPKSCGCSDIRTRPGSEIAMLRP